MHCFVYNSSWVTARPQSFLPLDKIGIVLYVGHSGSLAAIKGHLYNCEAYRIHNIHYFPGNDEKN